MRLKKRWAILLFALPVWTNTALAVDPALTLDQNVIRTWGVDQGLPQGTVYALAQTADGYVWAATQEGFVRFVEEQRGAPVLITSTGPTAEERDWRQRGQATL